MPRKVRKKILFNDEKSVNGLLQEIYDDSFSMKSKINRLFIKWEQHAKAGGEIAAIGEAIIKCIGAEAKNIDQKIMILKFLKEIFYKENVNDKKTETSEQLGILTTDKKNELLEMVQKAVDNSELKIKK